jgi:glyoxylase I family protein
METVMGIGGLFFRAKDPVALSHWYRDYLGVTPTPTNYDDAPEGNPVELWEPHGPAA